jgi:Family of unknown function (DUF6086)
VSQSYELGDVTLCNPSNGTSRLFLRQVALFEEELALPSGIGPMEQDEAQIDPLSLRCLSRLCWRARLAQITPSCRRCPTASLRRCWSWHSGPEPSNRRRSVLAAHDCR